MKVLRFAFVLAFVIGFVVLGMNGTAWAGKLGSGYQSPAASGSGVGPGLVPRPLGTTNSKKNIQTIKPIIPNTGGDQPTTVGSCATVLIESAPANVTYTASVVPEKDLAKVLPGKLRSCGIKITATSSKNLDARAQVCFPILPGKAVFGGYYWDGTKWVETTLDKVTDSRQSCVDIPTTVANLTYAALFNK